MDTSARTRFVRGLPIAALVFGMTVQVAYAAYLADRLWFFGDDWDFLLYRGLTGDPELSLWQPHNEHWSTVPIVLFRLMFSAFGLSFYLPYALMPIAAHVAIWTLMYVLLRRMGIAVWPAVLTAWVGGFLAEGIGAENTLWDFQIGFLGSGVLGLLAIFFLRTEGRWGLWAAWFALVLALASSGVGLVVVGWACLDVLLRRGIPQALITGAVPGLAYLAWFLLVGHQADVSYIAKDITAFPFRLAEGLNGVWSNALAMPGAGPAVLAGLIWVVFFRRHSPDAFALAASGLGTLLMAFTLFTYARSGLGEGSGSSSRYLYFGMVFCAPALALAIELASRKIVDRPFSRPVAVGVVMVLTAALGLGHLNRFSDDRAANWVGDLEGRLAATTRLIDANARLLGDQPSPAYNPFTLDAFKSAGVLDDLRKVPVSEEQLLDARGQLQVAVDSEAPIGLPVVRNVLWIGMDSMPGEAEPLDKCMTRFVTGEDAILQIAVSKKGTSIWVKTQNNEEIQTSLLDDDDESEPIRWPVESDDLISVESTASGATLSVQVPHGEVTICPHR